MFGPLRLGHGGEGVPGLRSRKAVAILAYVAAQEKPLPRAHLVDCFWPDESNERGHANLRWALNHLTSLLPGCLSVSRHSVAWGSSLACDLHRFTQHLHQNTISSLTAAVEIYQGELMAGFVLDGCPEFELWLTTERAHRLQQMVQTLDTLIQCHRAQQNYPIALAFVQRWLALTPWAEEAHRQAIFLFAASGQRSAALQQYAVCRQALATEFGVEPATETTVLYEEIRSNGKGQSNRVSREQVTKEHTATLSPHHNLPRQFAPVIGRTAEIAQIEQLLADPTCVWLTLLGPGGIGKTHLALAVAHKIVESQQSRTRALIEPGTNGSSETQAPAFPDGVWFVALAGVTAVELLPATLAQTLGLSLMPGDVRQQLLNYLGSQQLLLVLDSFEHLLEGVDLLEWLLQEAPGVKVLVTSRQRFEHQDEWVLDVGGLETPPMAASRELASYSAVQLFVQCARRVLSNFAMNANNAALISQVCRAVEGMPLGIQLAASWVRILPLATIAEEISHNLDFGTPATHGIPDRHRTLRAVIDSSWRRLDEAERTLLARLSVFCGGTDWPAAEEIAGATPILVSQLFDKSLLYMDSMGRIMLHEFVRQFAAEQLQAMKLTEETKAAHSRYYSSLLARQMDGLISGQTQAILQQWDGELDNLRAAWQWAVQRCDAALIRQMTQPLNLYFDYRTLLQEGRQRFQQVVEALRLAPPTSEHEIALGTVLARYGLLLWRYGEMTLAEQVLHESRTIASRHGVTEEEAYASYLLGYYYAGLEHSTLASEYLEKALALAKECADERLSMKILYALGFNHLNGGQIETSISTLQQSLQLARSLGDMRSVAHTLCYLGSSYFVAKDYIQSRQCLQEGLGIFQSLGIQWGIAQAQYGLLKVAHAERDYTEVKRLYDVTLPLYEKSGAHREALTTIQHIYQSVCTSPIPSQDQWLTRNEISPMANMSNTSPSNCISTSSDCLVGASRSS
ncbi:MAG: BTAD domain-containing putative transcriptional regulator [Caldilineaceae bacterium]